jgi:hypothetical protein
MSEPARRASDRARSFVKMEEEASDQEICAGPEHPKWSRPNCVVEQRSVAPTSMDHQRGFFQEIAGGRIPGSPLPASQPK